MTPSFQVAYEARSKDASPTNYSGTFWVNADDENKAETQARAEIEGRGFAVVRVTVLKDERSLLERVLTADDAPQSLKVSPYTPEIRREAIRRIRQIHHVEIEWVANGELREKKKGQWQKVPVNGLVWRKFHEVCAIVEMEWHRSGAGANNSGSSSSTPPSASVGASPVGASAGGSSPAPGGAPSAGPGAIPPGGAPPGGAPPSAPSGAGNSGGAMPPGNSGGAASPTGGIPNLPNAPAPKQALWWNAAINNPVANSLMNLPATPAIAAAAAIGSLKSVGQSGADIVSHLVRGIKSGMGALMEVSSEITTTIMGGLTKPLGRSGSAVTGLVGRGMGAAGNMLNNGVDMIGGFARTGAKIAGVGAGLGMAALGAGVGGAAGLAVGSVPGVAVGAVLGTMVAAALGKVMESLASVVSTALSALAKAFGEFGKMVGDTLRAVSDVLEDVTGEALKYAQAVKSIELGGGYSAAGAGSLVQGFNAFGISPETTAGAFSNQNALFAGAKAQMWGIGGLNANGDVDGDKFLSGLRERFQSMISSYGPQIGTMLGRAMLQNFGVDSPEMRQVASLSDEKFGRQQAFGKSLSVDPDAASAFAEDFALLKANIGQFAQWMKVTFASDLIPFLKMALGGAVDYLKAHQDDIKDALRGAAKWLFVDLPILATSAFETFARVISSVVLMLGDFLDPLLQKLQGNNGGQGGSTDWVDKIAETLIGAINGFVGAVNLFKKVMEPLLWSLYELTGSSGITEAISELNSMKDIPTIDWKREKEHPDNALTRASKGIDGWADKAHDLNKSLRGTRDERVEKFDKWAQAIDDNTQTMKGGIHLQTETKISAEPTTDLVAKVASYTALATWRKMNNAVG